MARIAILFTCHNRRVKTLSCLNSIEKQAAQGWGKPDIYLVDDGSTDGTAEAVIL